MTTFAVTALSPLDGRYANKLKPLQLLMSEHGFMQRRVQVEVAWFIALSDAGMPEFAPLSNAARSHLRQVVQAFSPDDTLAIKAIERTTNHDVKAVEYWLKDQCQLPSLSEALRHELTRANEFIHFACTSEDINNTSHA
jgi:adenylosuccinate lyase